MTDARAWSFLAISGTRQYGGNTGYEDDPAAIYRYDDHVANHLGVHAGDIAIVRSQDTVLGIAIIEKILHGAGEKIRQRCPECQSVDIKSRSSRVPRWRCRIGHLFEEPTECVVTVRTFEAHYGRSFKTGPLDLTLERLNAAVMRPSDQMSIKEIDLALLEKWLLKDETSGKIVRQFAASLGPEDIQDAPSRPVSLIEDRRRVLREITLRRGQARFRNRLMKRYGARCQISMCDFTGLIEAAHIRPYSSSTDNGEGNGLLLRSDLHTLFDLGLLAVHPTSLRISLHPDTLPSGYRPLEGVALGVNGTSGPDRAALTERWEFFQKWLPTGKQA